MRVPLTAVVAALAAVLPVPFTAAPAYAAADITADVRAGRDVVLSGDAVVTVPLGETRYGGSISGSGTLTVAGSGTLVLTGDSDFTLPESRRTQTVRTDGDETSIVDPDPPAITVGKGATLQYEPGVIGHFRAVPGFELNELNIQVDGTLVLATQRRLHLGIVSGSGFISARRFVWPGTVMMGEHPFSGTIENGTGMDLGSINYLTALPNVRKILNQGTTIAAAPRGATEVIGADFYSREWGNDVNFHTWEGGEIVMTGVYSWADSGPDADPSLSDPGLNYEAVAHDHNKRGINIEGANVRWGDGTTDRFFLPGNEKTVYVNMHFDGRERSRLTFDYNGPVTLSAPISGGRYHDTLDAPGLGDVVIAGTDGNDVTFTAPQNYDGATIVENGAVLRLGDGKKGGDAALLTGTEHYAVVLDGELHAANAVEELVLSRISGDGSFVQDGEAGTVFTGKISYTGATTITEGTLALDGGSLAKSSGVEISGPQGTLDLTDAGEQTLKGLSGVAGATVSLGDATLTVDGGEPLTYGGSITGDGGVVKAGEGVWTLTGTSETPGGPWTVEDGTLRLDGGGSLSTGDFAVPEGGVLCLAGSGAVTANGTVTLAGGLELPERAGGAPDGEILVVDNRGSEPISGTFEDLAEGAEVTVDGASYQIGYAGGDGNDVVLSMKDGAGTGAFDPFAAGGAGDSLATILLSATGVLMGLLVVLSVVLVWRKENGRKRPRDPDQE